MQSYIVSCDVDKGYLLFITEVRLGTWTQFLSVSSFILIISGYYIYNLIFIQVGRNVEECSTGRSENLVKASHQLGNETNRTLLRGGKLCEWSRVQYWKLNKLLISSRPLASPIPSWRFMLRNCWSTKFGIDSPAGVCD